MMRVSAEICFRIDFQWKEIEAEIQLRTEIKSDSKNVKERTYSFANTAGQ